MGTLHIVSGDDDFAIKTHVRELVSTLAEGGVAEDDSAFEIIEGDMDGGKPSEICERMISALHTPPFLSDHQVIWLRNFASFELLCSNHKGKGIFSELAKILVEPLAADQTVLINGAGLDMRKAFSKALKNAGADIKICSTLKVTDRNFSESRRTQINQICSKAGKRILPSGIQYLEATLGGNSGVLLQELEKLFCYVGAQEEISVEDCRAICSRTPEAVSWNFTTALVERNLGQALQLLDELMKQGEPEIRLLAGVSNEYQRLIQVRDAMQCLGLNRVHSRTFDQLPESVRESNKGNMLLGLHPFRAYKMCELAQKYNDGELALKLNCILETNRGLVSGLMDNRVLLEKMIYTLVR